MVFYRLKIRTIQDAFIHFSVQNYTVVDDGAFIEFTDKLTQRVYRFPVQNVNIEKLDGTA